MSVAIECNVRPLRRPATSDAGRRRRANMPARVKIGSNRATCMVTDMSSTGACLAFDGPLDSNVQLWLIVENMPPIPAVTAWRKRDRVGLRFESDQDWVHKAHRDRFDPAAWLNKHTGLN